MNLSFNTYWSNEDKEFIGYCKQFPSLSYMDKDEWVALMGIIKLTNKSITDLGKDYSIKAIQKHDSCLPASVY